MGARRQVRKRKKLTTRVTGCAVKVCDPRGAARGVGACNASVAGFVREEPVCEHHLARMSAGIVYSTVDGKTVWA